MVKCGRCGAGCAKHDCQPDETEWFECQRCHCLDSAGGHIQERDRRINEAALAIYASGHYPGMSDSAIDDAERLVAAQDAAAQERREIQ